jgi:hypothetical protein
MPVKRKSSKRSKSKKSYVKRKSSRRHTRKMSLRHRPRRIRGGNYETDVTTRELEGVPTKPLNKIVVTVPGYGTMSGTAYKKLAEEIDRDGPDAFLK